MRVVRRSLPTLAAAAVVSVLAACASAPKAPLACAAGQSRATTAEMVFGRDVGHDLGVSEADWRAFLDEEITPRFPDGLSVADVQGQWKASDGTIVREPSKVLYLVLDGGPDDPAKIAHIRDAYKARFHQDSVLLITNQACVAF